MGTAGDILNLAGIGVLGYVVYRSWPTLKAGAAFLNQTIDTANAAGSFLFTGAKDVVDPKTSFLNPYNWVDNNKLSDMQNPTGSNFSSWGNMTYDQAKTLGVVDQYQSYVQYGDPYFKPTIAPAQTNSLKAKISTPKSNNGNQTIIGAKSGATIQVSDKKAASVSKWNALKNRKTIK